MRKNIDIDNATLTKPKVISAFQNLIVNVLMEKAVLLLAEQKTKEPYELLTDEQKEDVGLLALIQQADMTDTVSEDEYFKALEE